MEINLRNGLGSEKTEIISYFFAPMVLIRAIFGGLHNFKGMSVKTWF